MPSLALETAMLFQMYHQILGGSACASPKLQNTQLIRIPELMTQRCTLLAATYSKCAYNSIFNMFPDVRELMEA